MITRSLLGCEQIDIIEVDPFDPRLAGDYAIGFTLPEMAVLMFGVKFWTLASTLAITPFAPSSDWWTALLPSGQLANNNVFRKSSGEFLNPFGGGDLSSPY